jgi:hypothetical protein
MVEVGGVAQVKQAVRERRAGAGLEALWQDVRFAFRTLGRDKGFTAIAVLILAVGIGGNVAVFSVVNGMLLRPLGFRDPEQLAWMSGNDGQGGLGLTSYQVGAYQEFARLNRSFSTVTAFVPYYELVRDEADGEWRSEADFGRLGCGGFLSDAGCAADIREGVHARRGGELQQGR